MAEFLRPDEVREVFDYTGVDPRRAVYLGTNIIGGEAQAWVEGRVDIAVARADLLLELGCANWVVPDEVCSVSTREGMLYLANRIGQVVTIDYFSALDNSRLIRGVHMVNPNYIRSLNDRQKAIAEYLYSDSD